MVSESLKNHLQLKMGLLFTLESHAASKMRGFGGEGGFISRLSKPVFLACQHRVNWIVVSSSSCANTYRTSLTMIDVSLNA